MTKLKMVIRSFDPSITLRLHMNQSPPYVQNNMRTLTSLPCSLVHLLVALQLLNTEDEWLDIVPGDDEIVINVGDMLQRLTNNYLISTTHRVVNPPKSEWHKPRLSIPFFLHPKSDMRLDCLDFCVTNKRPLQYEPTSAGEYLDERLREIGLKK